MARESQVMRSTTPREGGKRICEGQGRDGEHALVSPPKRLAGGGLVVPAVPRRMTARRTVSGAISHVGEAMGRTGVEVDDGIGIGRVRWLLDKNEQVGAEECDLRDENERVSSAMEAKEQ